MNEVKVKANATLNFELEVDAQTLDAVTVVAGKTWKAKRLYCKRDRKQRLPSKTWEPKR